MMGTCEDCPYGEEGAEHIESFLFGWLLRLQHLLYALPFAASEVASLLPKNKAVAPARTAT